jgi:hypothetical protein
VAFFNFKKNDHFCLFQYLEMGFNRIVQVIVSILYTTAVLLYMVKVSLCFNLAPRHEGVLGSEGIDPLIL